MIQCRGTVGVGGVRIEHGSDDLQVYLRGERILMSQCGFRGSDRVSRGTFCRIR
jgi:hypothetical protein